MFKLFVITSLLFVNILADDLIRPIPSSVKVDEEKAALGKKLFFDTRLSHDDTVACVSCHNITDGGADYTKVSTGVEGRQGNINSPTVFNSVYNIAQFWDGRAKDLQTQAKGPIENPVEMASSAKEVIEKLSQDTEYTKSFASLYQDGITFENIANAIAEFEKTLITPDSRFDKFLKGDSSALSKDEKEGYTLFKELGCISCHNGVNLGSNMFQKFGIFADHNNSLNNLGRYNVTKKEADRYFFKVPTLRNVAKTAPYFHDGSAATLYDAVKTMGYYQLGRKLSDKDIKKIVFFLKTLNGNYKEHN